MSTPSRNCPTPGAVKLTTSAAEHRVHDQYGDADVDADTFSHDDLKKKGSSTRPSAMSYEDRKKSDQEEIRLAQEAQSSLDRERDWQLKRGEKQRSDAKAKAQIVEDERQKQVEAIIAKGGKCL